MRQDFDYVTMDDYSRDMAESSSRAAEIIQGMKAQKKEITVTLIAAVLSAGGKLTIKPNDFIDADSAILSVEKNPVDDTTILKARR